MLLMPRAFRANHRSSYFYFLLLLLLLLLLPSTSKSFYFLSSVGHTWFPVVILSTSDVPPELKSMELDSWRPGPSLHK